MNRLSAQSGPIKTPLELGRFAVGCEEPDRLFHALSQLEEAPVTEQGSAFFRICQSFSLTAAESLLLAVSLWQYAVGEEFWKVCRIAEWSAAFPESGEDEISFLLDPSGELLPAACALMLGRAVRLPGYARLCPGGEPLLQIDFLIELFRKAKKNGVHTTLDTSGNPFTREEPYFSKFNELMKYTDLLLLDIKLIDDKAHRELTGCTNENILDLARYLDEIGKPVWIRHVLVPERSDYDEYLIRLDEFLHSLHNVQRVEVLPYHTLGVFKWETLGIPYKLEGINPPTKERVENANKLLHTAEYTGYLK